MAHLVPVELPVKRLRDYTHLTPEEVDHAQQQAASLQGLRVIHLNATAQGGGVAEMLRPAVALQRDIGLDAHWYTLNPDAHLFTITKKLHNQLQGQNNTITDAEWTYYLKANDAAARDLTRLQADVIIIHDPQPAAIIATLSPRPRLLWRCHIDLTHPDPATWSVLMPYIAEYDLAIYSMPEFIPPQAAPTRVRVIPPVIDPLSPKNIAMPHDEAKQLLSQHGLDIQRPLLTQVSRLDPWKDPLGVIEAYRLVKQQIPGVQLALLAQSATDDPEGQIVEQQVRRHLENDPDLHLLIDLPNNDQVVNALQSASTIIIQKSLREGFGLTVTEAMWKSALVVAGNVGGIRSQITTGVNGYLVDSVATCAHTILQILNHPEQQAALRQAAHTSVRDRFLITHDLVRWLPLLHPSANEEGSSGAESSVRSTI